MRAGLIFWGNKITLLDGGCFSSRGMSGCGINSNGGWKNYLFSCNIRVCMFTVTTNRIAAPFLVIRWENIYWEPSVNQALFFMLAFSVKWGTMLSRSLYFNERKHNKQINKILGIKMMMGGTSLVVGNLPCNSGDIDLILGQETKIQHAWISCEAAKPSCYNCQALVLQLESWCTVSKDPTCCN